MTVYFYLDDTVVYTMGQHCLVCLLKVKEIIIYKFGLQMHGWKCDHYYHPFQIVHGIALFIHGIRLVKLESKYYTLTL